MPFDPLLTDEKLEGPQKGTRDMDTHMIVGCTGFGIVAFLTYALGIWPHFAFTDTHLVRTLLLSAALGILPALILGVIGIRKFGLAGASGFVGGAMAVAVFLFLRMKQASLGRYARDKIVPDYPDSWVWIAPAVLVVVAVLLAVVAMPKGEFEPTGADRKKRP